MLCFEDMSEKMVNYNCPKMFIQKLFQLDKLLVTLAL